MPILARTNASAAWQGNLNHAALFVISHVSCESVVEAGGVEPPSENTSSGTSPGADGSLHSLAMAQAVMLHGSVASFVMPGAKLTPVTCTTQITPKPGSWSFRGGRPLLSSGENSLIVVL